MSRRRGKGFPTGVGARRDSRTSTICAAIFRPSGAMFLLTSLTKGSRPGLRTFAPSGAERCNATLGAAAGDVAGEVVAASLAVTGRDRTVNPPEARGDEGEQNGCDVVGPVGARERERSKRAAAEHAEQPGHLLFGGIVLGEMAR